MSQNGSQNDDSPFPPNAAVIPREAMDTMLKSQGLGGVALMPRKLALFFGRDNVPPEAQVVADELAEEGSALVVTLTTVRADGTKGRAALAYVVR